MISKPVRSSLIAAAMIALLAIAFAASTDVLKPAAGATQPEEAPTSGGATPDVLWSADMEEGTLADWYSPQPAAIGNFGGGEYNSDGGVTTVSDERSRSGSFAAKLTLPGGHGGTRLFRWRELRRHQETLQTAWFFFPRSYTKIGTDGSFLNLFQFKSRSISGAVDPMWYLDVSNPTPDRMRLDLVWWPRALEGPRHGELGFRRLTQHIADIPVGRWFELRAQLRQSKDFDGVLRIWQDGQLIFDMTGIRTSYTNCRYTPWCAVNEWAVNNYSDLLTPSPSAIFVDDARIERP